MESLNYIAQWEKIPEKTWSGTTLALRDAMSLHFNIQNTEIKMPTKTQRVHYALLNKIINGNFELNMNFNKRYLQTIDKKISKVTLKKNNFQIGDIISSGSYCTYQDLSISALIKIAKENPEQYSVSGFDYSIEQLNRRNLFQKNVYSNAKYIFTMSKWLEKHLIHDESIEHSKVIHVGGGINVDADKISTFNKNRNTFLFIGRDSERKGLLTVLKAFDQLYQSDNNLRLIIAGPSKLGTHYLNNGVIFKGDICSNEIAQLFNQSDVFVMPSKFEAYGLVYIEALTFGLPVIALDRFEAPYFVEHGQTGYLAKTDTVEEISHLMIKAINNKKMKNNVVAKKNWYIDNYSWESVASRIYNVLSNQ